MRHLFTNRYIWLSKRLHAMPQKNGGLQDVDRLVFLLLQRTKAGFFRPHWYSEKCIAEIIWKKL